MRTSVRGRARGAHHGVVARQGAGHVLGRLAGVDADLEALDVDGMTTERHHGQLGGAARAGRGFLEHAGRRPAPASTCGSLGHRDARRWRARRRARRTTGRRRRGSAGSRRRTLLGTVRHVGQRATEQRHGLVDLVVAHQQRRAPAGSCPGAARSPRARARAPRPPRPWPARASSAAPSRSPAPRTPMTPSSASSPAASRAPARAARAGTSSASITASVARAAAAASGWPPKVLPWSPGRERRRHLGPGPARPDGHAVAERLGHRHHVGLDPGVLEPEPPAPCAPGPVWISSTMSRMPRSVHSSRTPPR